MRVKVILLLLSRGGSLIIDDKVDRKRGTFKLNMNIRGGVD